MLAESYRDLERIIKQRDAFFMENEKLRTDIQIMNRRFDLVLRQRNQMIIGFDQVLTDFNKVLIHKLDEEIWSIK